MEGVKKKRRKSMGGTFTDSKWWQGAKMGFDTSKAAVEQGYGLLLRNPSVPKSGSTVTALKNTARFAAAGNRAARRELIQANLAGQRFQKELLDVVGYGTNPQNNKHAAAAKALSDTITKNMEQFGYGRTANRWRNTKRVKEKLDPIVREKGVRTYFRTQPPPKEGQQKKKLSDALALFKWVKGEDGVRRRQGDISGWPQHLVERAAELSKKEEERVKNLAMLAKKTKVIRKQKPSGPTKLKAPGVKPTHIFF